MTISLPALLILLVIAAVCGALGKAIAGGARGDRGGVVARGTGQGGTPEPGPGVAGPAAHQGRPTSASS